MGFDKKYITKDRVISSIRSNSLKSLFKGDALLMDNWSRKFYDHYDFTGEFQKMRDELTKEIGFSSFIRDTLDHKNFSKLITVRNLSNILENLIKYPNWIEILLTFEILGDDGFEKFAGKFPKESCISKISDYFTVESREDSLNRLV